MNFKALVFLVAMAGLGIPVAIFAQGVNNTGPGNVLSFDGTNDWVDCTNNGGSKQSATTLGLPDTAITLEAWVKPATYQTWDGIVGFLQDNGSTESGWNLELNGSNTFRFGLSSAGTGTLTYLAASGTFNTNEWYHVAGTYDGDTMKIYVNGVLANTSTAQTGSINYLDSWLAIGTYRDDNENNRMQGDIDEVRIWDYARSEQELRNFMCQGIDPNTSGLVSYFRMNELQGSTTSDLAGSNDGLLTGMDTINDWTISGAPIGDTSAYAYTTSWTGTSVSLASGTHGTLEVDSVTGTPDGVHVYFVDDIPSDTLGISVLNGNNGYFGTFATGGTSAYYDVNYDYSSLPAAITFESGIQLYARESNDISVWTDILGVKDTSNNMIVKDSIIARGEWIIGNFLQGCTSPSALMASNVLYTSADLSWTTGGSGLWNIEYGLTGFTQGTGTTVTTGANPFMLNGLQDTTSYDIYVQDTCAGIGTSAWFGPITVITLSIPPCNTPTNLAANNLGFSNATLSWTTGGSGNWNIEFDTAGFTQGNGTVVSNLTSNPYVLSGLQPGTTYEFYVQDTCNNINASAWAGPFSFTTIGIIPNNNTASGNLLEFDGSNDWVDCSNNGGAKESATTLGLPDTAITLEAWVRPATYQTWDGIVGFLQDNGSTEAGWNLELNGSSTFRFGLSSAGTGTLTYLPANGTFNTDQWYHVAGTYDGDTMRIYVNGILANSNGDQSGAINYLDSWLAIGSYRDDNENNLMEGNIDEVRIWEYARSESEIRANMCSKLTGNENGLVSYWRFDEGQGSALADQTSTANHGALIGFDTLSDWATSSVPLGDTSIYVYPSSWGGQSLTLNSANGDLTADNVNSTGEGMHIYRVDNIPNSVSGISAIASNNRYYGVYVVSDTNPSYDIEYDYAGYTLAVQNEDSIELFNRAHNAVGAWVDIMASLDASNDLMFENGVAGQYNEFMLGNFTSFSCTQPSGLAVGTVTFNSVELSWTSGGASLWNVEYGPQGYTQGSGTLIAANTNPFTVNGLSGSTAYDFYVQDNCGTQGTSPWEGPVSATTMQAPACNAPSNLGAIPDFITAELSWTTGGSSAWNIEYGPQGYTQGTGTQVSNVNANPYILSGLTSQTSYDFYVQDTCNQVNASAWVGPFTFTTTADYSQIGAGIAIDIDGQGWVDCTNNGGDKTDFASVGLSDDEITVEAWVKVDTFLIWHSIAAFIQDNGQFEKGWSLETGGGNKFRFAISSLNAAGGLEYVETTTQFKTGEWYHVVGSYDGDSVKVIVNGELEGFSVLQDGAIDYADSWLSIGSYKDDNEDIRLDGVIDEVRIWDNALSYSHIREYMCQKLSGNEPGLSHYWTLNDGAGNMVTDLGPNNLDGTFQGDLDPGNAWVVSGAALGDTSIYVHTDFVNNQNVTLQLSSANRGDVMLNNIDGALKGIHLYQVSSAPNFISGINDIGDQDVYYGVYVTQDPNGNPSLYDLEYDYANYPNAVSNENFLTVYNRLNASVQPWINSGAVLDAGNDEMNLTQVGSRREIVLADFTAPSCPPSSGLSATNITETTADLSWAAGGGSTFNMEYGPAGFSLGAGTSVTGLSSASYNLTGLMGFTQYDYYVQDVCAGNDLSSWVGPFTFTTVNPCPSPISFAVDSVVGTTAWFSVVTNGNNTDWSIQYGPTGFTFGFGIQSVVSGNPFSLGGLLPLTTYDAYIQANCDPLFSAWVGPVSFTTDSALFISDVSAVDQVKVYPNPTQGQLVIETDQSTNGLTIEIMNMTGELVWAKQDAFGTARHYIDLSGNASGMYMVRVKGEGINLTRRVVLQ